MSKEIKGIRIFRFRHYLIKNDEAPVEYRADGPLPIYNDENSLIGFGTAVDEGSTVHVQCAMNPETPERMEMQLGDTAFWLDAILECRGLIGFTPTVAHIRGLVLSKAAIPGQDPISLNAMEMSQ